MLPTSTRRTTCWGLVVKTARRSPTSTDASSVRTLISVAAMSPTSDVNFITSNVPVTVNDPVSFDAVNERPLGMVTL